MTAPEDTSYIFRGSVETREPSGVIETMTLSIGQTLNFFSSVIKSGESWSGQCQEAFDSAHAQLAELRELAERSPFVKAGPLSINREAVADVQRDSRHYMNGSETTLVVTMLDGRVHRIKHSMSIYDPIDIYEIERLLLS